MMDFLQEAINGLGFVFGAPGKMVRSGMVGENPFGQGNYWNGSDTAPTGRDLLEKAGWLSPNTPGLDFGDVAGFVTEEATNPWNLLFGAGMIGRGIRGGLGLFQATKAAAPAMAKGFGLNLGIGAGMQGLGHFLGSQPAPQPPQPDEMMTQALLDLIGAEDYDYGQ